MTGQKNTNFLSYLCILAAFFVLLFFTRNIFSELQVSLDERDQAKQIFREREATLSELNKLQNFLANNENELDATFLSLSQSFSQTDILAHIHGYAAEINTGDERLIIRDLSFSPDQQSDIGFRYADISLSVIVSSETTLFNFLNFLTSNTEAYKFYLSSFRYPFDEDSGNIQISIPLRMYYK